jgi:hypothetical protein
MSERKPGWEPTGAQLALELAQNPLTDDESFLQWVERHANRYIEAARQRAPMKIRNYDATTAEGLAFALLGCLDFGPEGKSMPTFRPEAIELIQKALDRTEYVTYDGVQAFRKFDGRPAGSVSDHEGNIDHFQEALDKAHADGK